MGFSAFIPDSAFYADPSSFRDEVEERSAVIRRSPLFHGLAEDALTHLAQSARTKPYRRGQTIFLQGQPVRSLLLVRAGCVKLNMTNLSGSEVIVGLCGPSEAIDLGLQIASRVHGVSAEAVSPCRILSWNALVIDELFRRQPVLSGNIRDILSRQLSELQERYSELSSDKVERRVASALARLARQFGQSVTGGVEVSFSREELAQMTGTTLFTVSRLISRWKEMGLLIPRREAVLVCDLRGLGEISLQEEVVSPKGPRSVARTARVAMNGTVPVNSLPV